MSITGWKKTVVIWVAICAATVLGAWSGSCLGEIGGAVGAVVGFGWGVSLAFMWKKA